MDLQTWTNNIHQIFSLELRKLIINHAFQRNYDIAEYLLFLIKHSEEALTDPLIELLQINDLLILYFGENKLAFYRSGCLEEWEVLKLYSFYPYKLRKFEHLLRIRKVKIAKFITRRKYARDCFKLCGQYLRRLPKYGHELTKVDYEFDLKESFFDRHADEQSTSLCNNIHYSYAKQVHIENFQKSWSGANNRRVHYHINVTLQNIMTFQKFKTFLEDKIEKGFSHHRVKYNVKIVVEHHFLSMHPIYLSDIWNYFTKYKSFVSEFQIHLRIAGNRDLYMLRFWMDEIFLKYIRVITISECSIQFSEKDKQWFSKMSSLDRVVIDSESQVEDISFLHSVKRIDLYASKLPYEFLMHGIPQSVEIILLKNPKLEYKDMHERKLSNIFRLLYYYDEIATPDEVSGYVDNNESYVRSFTSKYNHISGLRFFF
jgi:hypothetical protein